MVPQLVVQMVVRKVILWAAKMAVLLALQREFQLVVMKENLSVAMKAFQLSVDM